MSAEATLPFDFIEYLCAERGIARSAALKLLAAEVLGLAHVEAAPTSTADAQASTADRAEKR